MSLLKSKAILAKLMATENIIVEQRNVPTASFNTQTRILTIPVLDDKISPELYDLFMGHEVGHALWTKKDDLQTAIVDEKKSGSLLNIIEDARIEKLIKNKYPGLRNSFVKGYNELLEKNFFGTKGKNINELKFIDRINIYYKCGVSVNIQFDDEELEIIKEIDSNLTYSDVVKSYETIKNYVKKQANNSEEGESIEILIDITGDKFDGVVSGVLEDEISTDFDERTVRPEVPLFEKENKESNRENPAGKGVEEGVTPSLPKEETAVPDAENEALLSETDKALEENQKQLFGTNKISYEYGSVPDVDLNLMVIDHKHIWNRYRKDISNKSLWSDSSGTSPKSLREINEENKKVVSYLVKEFELRKNAQQSKKAQVSKTGELDMQRIQNYKFSDDIFRRITTIPGGKSHGIVLVLDWSGSMNTHLKNTVKQLISLVTFCRKIGIPFEVYAFTTQYYDEETRIGYKQAFVHGDLAMSECNMMNIISSRMNAGEMKYALGALLFISEPRQYANNVPDWIQLGGTPLDESIIAMMKIVPKFKRDYKLEIVNVVYLTDGDGSSVNKVHNKYRGSYGLLEGISIDFKNPPADYNVGNSLIIRDPVTKYESKMESRYGGESTSKYLEILKERTDANIVGFYILGGREYHSAINKYHREKDPYKIAKLKEDFRKNNYDIVTNSGFDEYYLIKAEGMDTDEDTEFSVKDNASTRQLATAFSKYANNRVNNRIVLNRFIETIS